MDSSEPSTSGSVSRSSNLPMQDRSTVDSTGIIELPAHHSELLLNTVKTEAKRSDGDDENAEIDDDVNDLDSGDDDGGIDADNDSDLEFEQAINTINNIPVVVLNPDEGSKEVVALGIDDGIEKTVEAFNNQFLNGEQAPFGKFVKNSDQTKELSEAEKFGREMDEASRNKGKRTRITYSESGGIVRRRRRKLLPPDLKGLMGEANILYVRGDRKAAISICSHIITKVPDAPEPYQTIAVLYSDLGEYKKSLSYALTAAHLGTNNADEWCEVAELSLALGNAKQAVQCYTQAIKRDIKDVDMHMKRAKLLEDMGERRLALKCYMRLLRILSPDQGPTILELAKMVANRYLEDNQWAGGRDAMEVVFNKCPGMVTSNEVNLMLDLLLNLKEYKHSLKILVDFCEIVVEFGADTETLNEGEADLTVLSCVFPEHIALDLLARLAVIMVHLKAFNMTGELINVLMTKADPESTGDLYLDVAEALCAENRHADALQLTTPLVSGTKYRMPAVWLRHAEILRACKMYEEAIEAYEIIVEQAPLHLEARISLSALLNMLGFTDRARTVLTQDPQRDVMDPGLLYKRCQLLKDDENNVEQYLAVGQLLLSRHCVNIRNNEEVNALSRLRRMDKKRSALCEVRKARGEPEMDIDAPSFVDGSNVPSVTEDWNLLYDLCKTCKRMGRYALFQQIAFAALGSPKFNANASLLRDLELLCLHSCILSGDTTAGYNLVRELILRKPSKRIWNLFNQVVQRAEHVRHNRFLIRLMMHNLDHEGLLVLLANSCLIAGTYKYALTDYMTAFRANPNPLVALLIGITLFQIACQKFSARKNSLVIQGLAFFGHYKQLRGPEGQQEVNYNLGRAFHQLGLLPAAIHHYEKVLEFKSELNTEYENILDLKREAAFNLHLIYLSSDAHDLARYYCHKYITV